jgi:Holliday junction resolvase RusA-like endonuclease
MYVAHCLCGIGALMIRLSPKSYAALKRRSSARSERATPRTAASREGTRSLQQTILKPRPATNSVELYLPILPPSANRLWAYGRGHVYKTDAYENWINETLIQINSQNPGTILGPYRLTLQFRRGKTRMDSDNIIKATNDILQKSGVVLNDRDCEGGSWRRVTSGYDGLYVLVEQAGVE